MASLVKIMTCLLAVENANINDTITVTNTALATISEIFHTLSLKPGEQVTLEQMLYSMMVGSANDAAVVIAEHVGGTVGQFVAMMNQRAKEIGCDSTNFTDPTGLGHTDQYTTARDMAKIVNEAIKNEDNSITYTLNMESVTDDVAYQDAMNEYYYENAKYDKMVQDINAKTKIIQQQDQQLELRLKQLDTEQNALSNEIEAVSKVVKDNVEKSFKTFGG